jgi:superoxide reductase
MSATTKVLKCEECGNIVEPLREGEGELSCCGRPMVLVVENSVDPALRGEKHVPVVSKAEGGFSVRVGSVLHPMVPEHYIEWIDIRSKDRLSRKYLTPGEEPEVVFPTSAQEVTARAYCNLHGLWKA